MTRACAYDFITISVRADYNVVLHFRRRNPPTLEVGKTYTFVNGGVSGSHPFRITGATGGLPITITVQTGDAPEYYCAYHSSMKAFFPIKEDCGVAGNLLANCGFTDGLSDWTLDTTLDGDGAVGWTHTYDGSEGNGAPGSLYITGPTFEGDRIRYTSACMAVTPGSMYAYGYCSRGRSAAGPTSTRMPPPTAPTRLRGLAVDAARPQRREPGLAGTWRAPKADRPRHRRGPLLDLVPTLGLVYGARR